MRFFKLLFFVCYCFCTANLFAQSPKVIEDNLLRSFKRIDYRSHDNEDANAVFAKKLKSYTEKNPATISYPFNSLIKEHLDISTSTDGLFRIYSWDTLTGGTMHFFESVFQYKWGDKTFAIIDSTRGEGDVRPNYLKVYTFKTDNKTYYLSVYLTIGSTKDVGNGIHVFTNKNGELIDANLIKTQSGLHSDLSYYYNFFSVVKIAFEKRPTIHFDNKTNVIDLPLIDGNENMTNKHILYKFTGQYFERVKN